MLMFGCMYAQIDSPADYNDYCHYTGGLVGLGLTRLFYTAGVEQFTPDYLSNAMGLFLRVRFFSSLPRSVHYLMHCTCSSVMDLSTCSYFLSLELHFLLSLFRKQISYEPTWSMATLNRIRGDAGLEKCG